MRWRVRRGVGVAELAGASANLQPRKFPRYGLIQWRQFRKELRILKIWQVCRFEQWRSDHPTAEIYPPTDKSDLPIVAARYGLELYKVSAYEEWFTELRLPGLMRAAFAVRHEDPSSNDDDASEVDSDEYIEDGLNQDVEEPYPVLWHGEDPYSFHGYDGDKEDGDERSPGSWSHGYPCCEQEEGEEQSGDDQEEEEQSWQDMEEQEQSGDDQEEEEQSGQDMEEQSGQDMEEQSGQDMEEQSGQDMEEQSGQDMEQEQD